jgi:hypothetical protein
MELLTTLRQDEALPLSVAQRKEIAHERWESLPAVIKDTFANAPKVAMYEALRRMDVDTQPSRAVEWAYPTRINSLVVTRDAFVGLTCHRDVATDGVREASRSHAFDSPSSSEGSTPERLDQTENTECVLPVFGDGGEGVRVLERESSKT